MKTAGVPFRSRYEHHQTQALGTVGGVWLRLSLKGLLGEGSVT